MVDKNDLEVVRMKKVLVIGSAVDPSASLTGEERGCACNITENVTGRLCL